VLVTDQDGTRRISLTDALGRLTEVWEVTPNDAAKYPGVEGIPSSITDGLAAASHGYKTVYGYDILGSLRQVTQGAQPPRVFTYDSLSRLRSAANPENGTVNYTYDDNGNLKTKLDARGVTTTYEYDRLNRNIITTYSGGGISTPEVRRHYDNGPNNHRGRLWYSQSVGVVMVGVGYDVMGRPKVQDQQYWNGGGWGAPYRVQRTYDLAGNVLTQTYPSGHIVAYNYDLAGRVADNGSQSAFTGNLGDGLQRTYASAVSYDETGGLREERFGTQTPLYHKLHYNARGQLYDVRLSTVPWAAGEWEWNRGAVVNYFTKDCQWQVSSSDNNGNLRCSEHAVPLDPNASYAPGAVGAYATSFQYYSYDELNRLTGVTEKKYATGGTLTPAFTQSYKYDRWGNRTIDANATQVYGQNQGYTIPEPQFELNPQSNPETPEPSNRLYAPGDANRHPSQKLMRYDAAGNLVHDEHTGAGARMYDAENRMTGSVIDVQGNWAYYGYDADGRRVKRKIANEDWWQIYGIGGEVLAEYRADAPTYLPTKEYGYRGGGLLVTMSSGDDRRLVRFVRNLYYGALHVDPQPSDVQARVNQLAAAGAQGQAQLLLKAKEIARSLFTQTTYETSPFRSDAQYVTDLYYAYLHRAPDTPGLNHWTASAAGGVPNRSNVCDAFQESLEFATLVSTLYGEAASDDQRTDRFIHTFYLGATGMIASPADLQSRRNDLNAAAAQGTEAVKAAAEQMGRSLFASQVTDLSIPAQQFVTNLYESFLQRGPDVNGLSHWTAQAGTTAQSRQLVLDAFAACDPFRELAGTLYRETFWLVGDHLGTPRMVADRTGSLAGVKRHDYLPFGEELVAYMGGRTPAHGYSAVDNVRQQFTGKERDDETGLDYFLARYYLSSQGRFTSPDEFTGGPRELFTFAAKAAANPTFYADLTNPQSLNKYSYCLNNPFRYIDPDGHKVMLINERAVDRRETKGRILYNLAPSERKYFTVKTEKGGGSATIELKGDVDKALGKPHTKAFEYLVETVRSDKTVRVAVSNQAEDKDGYKYDINKDAGGGAMVKPQYSKSGDPEIYLGRGGGTDDVMLEDGTK
ncbi:MAG: DUF4214 domain-containing protein, partial [Pyrinomonadaceae bacterium]